MTRTAQHLATTGTFNINAFTSRNIPSGIVDKDNNDLIPNFVEYDSCGLQTIGKNADGSFDVYNPDPFNKPGVRFRAHHLHSIEQEAIYDVGEVEGNPGPPVPDCALGFPFSPVLMAHRSVGEDPIPASPAFLQIDHDVADLNQQGDDVSFAQGSNGEIIFAKSGIYRLRGSVIAKYDDPSEPLNLFLALVKNPAGSAINLGSALSETRLDGGSPQLKTLEVSGLVAINESAPEADRTVALHTWFTGGPGGVVSTGDGQTPFSSGLEVIKVSELLT